MTSPFRVVRSYFRLPPEPGGMEEHIARLSTAQRAQGIEVINLFNVGAAEGPAVQIAKGRDLLHVRPAPLRNLIFYGGALMRTGALRADLPTVLHVHGDWSDFLLGRALGRAIGARALAASLHDRVPPAKAPLYRMSLRGYDPIFTTGRSDRALLESALGRPVHHMPSAPNRAFLDAAPAAPPFRYDVMSVANLFEKKAPGLVLDCAALRPELRFVLFGDGDLREALAARIARERLDNVELAGRRPRAKIITALRTSRLFLSTARHEGTPTAALEAMAVGLPVLLTPSNDYGWLIEEGRNGYVTSGWEASEIVARIDDLLADVGRAQEIGAANRSAAASRSWEANAEIVTGMMRRVLESKGTDR